MFAQKAPFVKAGSTGRFNNCFCPSPDFSLSPLHRIIKEGWKIITPEEAAVLRKRRNKTTA
jgi:hypothetical protein